MNELDGRLQRLAAAERRANWQDFDLRYGNVRKHPDVVQMAARRRGKSQAGWRADVGVLALLAAVIVILALA